MLIDVIYAVATTVEPRHVIQIPWGTWVIDWINDLAPVIYSAASVVVAFFVKNGIAKWAINLWLPKAINYAIATVQGAVSGKTLSIEVSNKVLDEAVKWLIQEEPKVVLGLNTPLWRVGDGHRPASPVARASSVPLP